MVQRFFTNQFSSHYAGQHSIYTLKSASLTVSYARGATTQVSFLSHTTWYPCWSIQFPEATLLPLELAAPMRMHEIKLHLHVSMRNWTNACVTHAMRET